MTQGNIPRLTDNRIIDDEQVAFFYECVNAWQRGESPDVGDQCGYVLQYIYLLNLEPPYEELLDHLVLLRDAYGHLDGIKNFYYLLLWISDCHVMLKQYAEAVDAFPKPTVGARASTDTDCLLSLKLAANRRIEGRDILTLYGAKLTSYGRRNINQIESYLDILLQAYEHEEAINLLENWAVTSSSHTYQVFRGSSYGYSATQSHKLPCYNFCLNGDIELFIKKITRDAENTVREEAGVPHVGEGWISETELYHNIKNAFPYIEVIHHASPSWLGRQHLDIYIPVAKLAIEYHGRQHDEPIAFFGGQEAYEQVKKRDARKKRQCTRNDVQIVYVRPGYDLNNLLAYIREVIENL